METMERIPGGEITDARLAVVEAEIKTIAQQVKTVALTGACEIGKRLLEVKIGLPHGRFLAWIEDNFDYSERQAQNMIALYEEYGKNPNPRTLEGLSVSQAVALLAAPAEVRAELIDSGAAEEMSVRALKEEILRYKKEIEERQTTIFQLEADAIAQKDLADKQAERAMEAEEQLKQARKDLREAESTGMKAVAEKNDFSRRLDFVNREKDKLVKDNADLEKRLSEAQAVEKVMEIEVTPPEVMQELERLRELERRAADENTVKARDSFERIRHEVNTMTVCMDKMDPEAATKYRTVFAEGMRRLARQLEGV